MLKYLVDLIIALLNNEHILYYATKAIPEQAFDLIEQLQI